jgi:hypothetical protein
VAKRGKRSDNLSTYRKAVALAEELMPEYFAPEKRLLEGAPETINTKLYRQLARVESARTGVPITAFEYARKEYQNLLSGLSLSDDDDNLALVKNKMQQVEAIMLELKPRTYSEHKMIFGDVLQVERNLPVSGEGRDYKQYKLDENRALRIRVLHPDPAEYKTGADVFYEHLDEERRRARLAIVQFKLWDGKSLHQEERSLEQIARMEGFACRNRLCVLSDDRRRTFRLPPCAAFLRPTDRLQDPDSKMYSTGLHVPLCVIKDAWEPNRNGGRSVRKSSIEDRSVSHEVFEELFNTRMLGGKELSFDELGELYKTFGVFEYDDTVQVHAQEFRLNEKTKGPKGRKKK